ncbi:unnamed protein product [Miscanthus lutarioriparius]|uniref:Uncharacterized protein n=1 Tax=Miscanthus lutarioriparius TaxID=422564 RepID=A0A811PUC9_9POAL|nr:unnamed protein product [Miscanthus lutarioriparius]
MNKMRTVDSLNFIPATNQQQHLQTNHLTADSSKKIPADVQLHNQGNLNEKNIVDPHNFVTAAEQLNTLNQITIAISQKFVPAVEKSSSTSFVSANVIKAPQDNQSAGVLPLSEKMDSTKAGIPGPEAVIVVFEGENHLLSAVLEASDSLYALAASLDMNLKLFFSQTPKSTDQIILNCIQNAIQISVVHCCSLQGKRKENDKVLSPPKLRKFSHIDDMMPDLPEVFMIDQRLNMGSEGVSCRPRKYDVDAVIGIHVIDDDFINELTPNFRTYNERASSMVDICNFSRQSKLGEKQPIRSSFRASMPSARV